MHYIRQIDGLRAIAVVLIAGYHWHVAGFGQGYLGVDAFFVISGYVITRANLEKATAGKLRPLDFYRRRIRRLFPAALTMIALTSLFQASTDLYGFTITAPYAVGAIGSVSNFLFWQFTGGYFAPATEEIPLVHTWSLAVEEQFYLLFPLALLLARSAKAESALRFRFALLAVTAGSLVVWATDESTSAFWLLPARAWQIGLGCLLAVKHRGAQQPAAAQKAPWCTLGAALLGALALSVPQWWPAAASDRLAGQAAQLLCCVATAMALAAARRGAGGPLLSNGVSCFVGRLSYSIYLWHWPVGLFLARHRLPDGPLMSALVTLCLAALSYYLVERPLRHGSYPVYRALLVGALLAAPAAYVYMQRDAIREGAAHIGRPASWQHRRYNVNPQNEDAVLEKLALSVELPEKPDGQEQLWRTGGVRLGGEGRAEVVVWGDSHAVMFGPAFRQIAEQDGTRIDLMSAGGGVSPWIPLGVELPAKTADAPAAQPPRARFTAETFARARIRHFLENRPKVLVVCRRPDLDRTSWDSRARARTFDWVAQQGCAIVVVTGTPIAPEATNYPVGALLQRWRFVRRDGTEWLAPRAVLDVPYPLQLDAEARDRLDVLDLGPLFDRGDDFLVADEDAVYLVDDDHLSTAGVLRCAGRMRSAILAAASKR